MIQNNLSIIIGILLFVITAQYTFSYAFAIEDEIYLFESENGDSSNEVTFSLLPKSKYVLDDETSIMVKSLHSVGSTEKVPFHHGSYDDGLPYVIIDDENLEIVNYVEISIQY